MNKIIGCLSLLLSPFAIAMQPLDDQSLSVATGQDGLNIGVNVSKVEFKQIAIIDTDGWDANNVNATEYRGRGALVIAQNANPLSNTAINKPTITAKNASGAQTDLALQAVIDIDKGTGANGTFANIALSFGAVNELIISPFSIYAANDSVLSTLGNSYIRSSIFDQNPAAPNTVILKSNVKELLRLQNGLNIKFVSTNQPTMNIQLGAAPQGKMIRFGGAIDSICGVGCNIMLVSGYDGSNNPIGASFNFQLKASNSSGFSLSKFYAGIEGLSNTDKGAFVLGIDNKSDNVDLKLNNIQFGNTAAIPATTDAAYRFNGLQNSAIGNIGFTQASVTDLKVRINGM